MLDHLGGGLDRVAATRSATSVLVSVNGQRGLLTSVDVTVISVPGIHPFARARSFGAIRHAVPSTSVAMPPALTPRS
jgi:hypothetical protein